MRYVAEQSYGVDEDKDNSWHTLITLDLVIKGGRSRETRRGTREVISSTILNKQVVDHGDPVCTSVRYLERTAYRLLAARCLIKRL